MDGHHDENPFEASRKVGRWQVRISPAAPETPDPSRGCADRSSSDVTEPIASVPRSSTPRDEVMSDPMQERTISPHRESHRHTSYSTFDIVDTSHRSRRSSRSPRGRHSHCCESSRAMALSSQREAAMLSAELAHLRSLLQRTHPHPASPNPTPAHHPAPHPSPIPSANPSHETIPHDGNTPVDHLSTPQQSFPPHPAHRTDSLRRPSVPALTPPSAPSSSFPVAPKDTAETADRRASSTTAQTFNVSVSNIEALEEELRMSQEYIEGLEKQLSEQNEEMGKKETALSELKVEVESLQKQLMAKQEYTEAREEDMETQLAAKQEHCDALQQRSAQLEEQLELKQETIEKLERQIASLEDRLRDKQEYTEKIERKVDNLPKQLKDKQEQVEALRAEVDGLDARCAEVERRLGQQLDEARADYTRLLEKEAAQRSLLQASENEKETLRVRANELAKQVASLTAEVEGLRNSTSALAVERDELRGENEDLDARVRDLERELDDLLEVKAGLEDERRRLASRVISLESAQQEMAQHQAQLRAENTRLLQEVQVVSRGSTPSPVLQHIQYMQHMHSTSHGTAPARQGTLGVDLDPNTLKVIRLLPGGPAEAGGLKKGDRIVSIRALPHGSTVQVDCVHVLRASLSISCGVKEGGAVEIGVLRKGTRKSFAVTLATDVQRVVNTTRRHLRELTAADPRYMMLDVDRVAAMITDESVLEAELFEVLGTVPLSCIALQQHIETLSDMMGFEILHPRAIHSLFSQITPPGGTVDPADIIPALKTAILSTIRDAELGVG